MKKMQENPSENDSKSMVSNKHHGAKNVSDKYIAAKTNESLIAFGVGREPAQSSKAKDKHKVPISSKLYPAYSSAVLIPSVSQRLHLSGTSTYGDNVLHPELMISPRSGDIVSRRGTFYMGSRRKLIIGSVGDIKGNLHDCKNRNKKYL